MKTFSSIASEIFEIEENKIRDDLTPKEIPRWDSMHYLLFISEIEKNFGFTFTMNEVMDSKTLGDIRKIVEAKGHIS